MLMRFITIPRQNSLPSETLLPTIWLYILMGSLLLSFSCSEEEKFTGRQVVYTLQAVSAAYDYEGTATFKELDRGVEITIQLSGNKGESAHYFPAHLHYGAYGATDAPMAAMLSPVDLRTLKSVTVVESLASGESFNFEDVADFDGHVKVHLSDDGPDYHIILVAGNIGKNKP